MASLSSSRIVSRLSSLALKFNNTTRNASLNEASLLKSAIHTRLSLISRLPVELSSLETMMPLHSAIASARLQSSLSLDSQRWGLVPQGGLLLCACVLSILLSPGLSTHETFIDFSLASEVLDMRNWYFHAFIVLVYNETLLDL